MSFTAKMTDSELIAEITNTAIIPFIKELDEDGVWDVDTVFESWETVYFLFMKHRPELKEYEHETVRMKERNRRNRRKQKLEEQLLKIQTELKSL